MEPSESTTTTIPSATLPTPPDKPTTPQPNRNPSPRATLIQRIRILLLRRATLLFRRIDRLLTRLHTLFSSPLSTDHALCTLSYSLGLLSTLLQHLLSPRLSTLPNDLASKTPPPTTTLLTQTASSTKVLSDLIADFRLFVRLWGLLGIYTWGRATYTTALPTSAGSKERWMRRLVYMQIVSIALFQFLENGAYLASKGVLVGEGWRRREVAWWVWSSRFWGGFVALEGVRLWVVRGGRGDGDGDGDGEKEGKIRRGEEERVWWRDAVSQGAYAPLTVHYGVEEGALGEGWVNALGMVAGGAMLWDAWRGTA